MTTTLCTLYNSLYLDKGLVLYDSLCECSKDFKLFVLCMDDICFEVLSDFGEKRLIPIRLVDIENKEMLVAKSNRTLAEYCWTCSSRLILYILEKFQPDHCTYIDADMFFYNDPQILVDEMILSGKSVMMVPHRFTERNEYLARRVGTYCVEFNCFRNNDAGLNVLKHWHSQCLDCCSNIGDGIHWGDQKYMDEWPDKFSGDVHVCEHVGAGVAPWNLELYQHYDDDFSLNYKVSNKRIPLIFYHFQSISYITRTIIRTGVKMSSYIDYTLVDNLYLPYLKRLDKIKDFLIYKYGLNLTITVHPSLNRKKWKQWINSFGFLRNIIRIIKKEPKDYIVKI